MFALGFRPFFFGAAVFAGIALPVWLGAIGLGWAPPSDLSPRDWHVHEMIFGYLPAVLAGFLLTAIPNWTGRPPIAGRPLALLFALWLAARLAMAASRAWPLGAAVVDAAFPAALAALAWREVMAGRNVRNAPVCLLVTLLAAADIGFHASRLGALDAAWAERMGLAVAALLIALIGGRVTPSFTGNWMKARNLQPPPAPFGAFDKVCLAVLVVTLAAWIVIPQAQATAALFAAAAVLHAARLARWRARRTVREPLLLALHLGYAWLPAWFALTALHGFAPELIAASAAKHALTAGAVGLMTVAVMSRASLGHGGRPLTADAATVAVYALILAGAALRVILPSTAVAHTTAMAVSGLLWSAGFALFAIRYAPILLALRARGAG